MPSAVDGIAYRRARVFGDELELNGQLYVWEDKQLKTEVDLEASTGLWVDITSGSNSPVDPDRQSSIDAMWAAS